MNPDYLDFLEIGQYLLISHWLGLVFVNLSSFDSHRDRLERYSVSEADDIERGKGKYYYALTSLGRDIAVYIEKKYANK